MPRPRHLSLLLLASTLFSLGCHAQNPALSAAAGQPLPPALARKVEVLLRQKAQLPPGAAIHFSPARVSEFPGYDTISVTFSADGNTSKPIEFLISTDGKHLAQLTKFDLSADPRTLLSQDNRPARGGPTTAPVLIVGFDDLECPFCARLHETIFPALTQRYGDKVRIVYKDFPLDQHPWAMRAAIDVNCLGAQSPTGYWDLVDSIHAHASDIGTGPATNDPKSPAGPKTLPNAEAQLDKMTRDEARTQKADLPQLDACIAKKDTTAIEASRKLGLGLNIDSTPVLFINGDKVDGAVPIEFIFQIVDDALRAENVPPPPPYVPPTPPAPPAATTTPAPTAAKQPPPAGK